MFVAATSAVIGPQIQVWGGGHGLGGWIAETLFGPSHARVSPFWINWVVARDASGFVSVGDKRSAEGARALADGMVSGRSVWTCLLHEASFPDGTWGTTSRRRIATLEVFVASSAAQAHGNLSSSELERLRSTALDGIKTQWPLEWPESESDLIAAGVWMHRHPILFGWFINAATLVGLAMFACTVRGTVRDIRRHQRALKYMRDGRCGWCGYDVRGLAGGVCPECGKAVRGTEEPAG
jgi:hypothetical protein